jgi:hypothetical protein
VHYLRLVFYAMTVLGAGLAIVANTLDLGAFWTLTGLMLVVAGIVKIVTVAIWNGSRDGQVDRRRGVSYERRGGTLYRRSRFDMAVAVFTRSS